LTIKFVLVFEYSIQNKFTPKQNDPSKKKWYVHGTKKLHGDESESLLYTTLDYVLYNFFPTKQMQNLHFFQDVD